MTDSAPPTWVRRLRREDYQATVDGKPVRMDAGCKVLLMTLWGFGPYSRTGPADPDGESQPANPVKVWASTETLAEESGQTISAVRHQLRKLGALGFARRMAGCTVVLAWRAPHVFHYGNGADQPPKPDHVPTGDQTDSQGVRTYLANQRTCRVEGGANIAGQPANVAGRGCEHSGSTSECSGSRGQTDSHQTFHERSNDLPKEHSINTPVTSECVADSAPADLPLFTGQAAEVANEIDVAKCANRTEDEQVRALHDEHNRLRKDAAIAHDMVPRSLPLGSTRTRKIREVLREHGFDDLLVAIRYRGQEWLDSRESFVDWSVHPWSSNGIAAALRLHRRGPHRREEWKRDSDYGARERWGEIGRADLELQLANIAKKNAELRAAWEAEEAERERAALRLVGDDEGG